MVTVHGPKLDVNSCTHVPRTHHSTYIPPRTEMPLANGRQLIGQVATRRRTQAVRARFKRHAKSEVSHTHVAVDKKATEGS